MSFHETLFPVDVSMGARGGPERRTEIVVTGSGREERNQRWSRSRRKWNAGYGVKRLSQIESVVAFFEERRGRLYGFRWRDPLDNRSCPAGAAPTPLDQTLGVGDGQRAEFQLVKHYGSSFAPYTREIRKPASGSVRVAVDGVEIASSNFAVSAVTGLVTFEAAHVPQTGASVTAGFLFDTPARFDADYLEIDVASFEAGEIPDIPLIEIVL
ncbi:MAG: TIGR02217 family protein [Beijerinckiaceae bacterium]